MLFPNTYMFHVLNLQQQKSTAYWRAHKLEYAHYYHEITAICQGNLCDVIHFGPSKLGSQKLQVAKATCSFCYAA